VLRVNIPAYFDRIGYTGLAEPTLEVLRELHGCHMLNVPFENLDIGLGRKIVCDESAFVRKIVDRRRGGFCYELNGAFATVLGELGFRVTLLSARVPRGDGSEGPEFDHLALRVDLDEPWLADVGFGDSFVEPLRLKVGLEQVQGQRQFRITDESQSLNMEMAEAQGNWKRQYSFTLIPRMLEDFAEMCQYHQTSPESPFTKNRICSQATRDGRVTLAGLKLIVTRDGNKEEKLLTSEEEWRATLGECFGLVL